VSGAAIELARGIGLGGGAPLPVIAGPCVVESEEVTFEAARAVAAIAARLGCPLVFKASFDKANRSSITAYRGPGLEAGLRILAAVQRELGLALLTDVHEPAQCARAAEVCDVLQIPAFLCRQTDLVAACAATGLPLNFKKGQFMAPLDMRHAVEKAQHFGAPGVFLSERGFAFGYNDLVVDFRGLLQMRRFAPVCFDATHSVQHPGGAGTATDGDRRMVAPLARAAVAIGIDSLFVEAHPDPENAPCDGPSQIDFEALDALLGDVRALDRVVRERA
jgi:2-dehydro-3-deoxyphosphooctonate aldolase (KDO 8-P synthase)